MVSLGNESTRSGGFYFDADLRSDTEDLISDTSLKLTYRRTPLKFHVIKTVYTTPFAIIYVIGQVIAAFLFPIHYGNASILKNTSAFSLLLYIHASGWFIFLLYDIFARYHHTKSRRQGYLNFYSKTRCLRRIPLFIWSGGSAALLILTTILNDFCNLPCHHNNHHNLTDTFNIDKLSVYSSSHDVRHMVQNVDVADVNINTATAKISTFVTTAPTTIHPSGPDNITECCPALPLNRGNYLQILFCIEAALLIPVLLFYFIKTIQFNRLQPQADVIDDDQNTTRTIQEQNSPVEIGFRDEMCIDDLMEKQAEMIRYLKDHNEALGRRVLALTSELQQLH